MASNYFIEYQYIPFLVEQCKNGEFSLDVLQNIDFWKTDVDEEVDWSAFSVEKREEDGVTYFLYDFPPVEACPDAKYGAVAIKDGEYRYYTLESHSSTTYFLCGPEFRRHHNYGHCKDMTKQEFFETIKGKYLNFLKHLEEVRKSPKTRKPKPKRI